MANPAPPVAVLPCSLFAEVSDTSAVPLYAQIADRLTAAIDAGILPAGSRLESERELERRIGRSYVTIRHAVELLVGRGLLVRRRGIGTIVLTRHSDPTKLPHEGAR